MDNIVVPERNDNRKHLEALPQSFIESIPESSPNSAPTSFYEASQLQPIVWAIDAFPDEEELQLLTASALQNTFPGRPIHPIYVLSEESFTDRSITGFLKPALKPMAFKALQKFLDEARLNWKLSSKLKLNLRKPRILIENSASRAACARKLLRYTKKIGAEFIAMSSHGRHGLSRLFVGSFSNAVINRTTVPLFMTGPQSENLSSQPKVIVFPTDFSPACDQAYDGILNLAALLKAEVHLFHKTILSMDPAVQSGANLLGAGWLSADVYLSQPVSEPHAEAERWIERARLKEVKTVFISENFSEPTSEAIIQYVSHLKENTPLLAMVLQTGPLASAILGSVTRDVIRLSPCPIYIAPRDRTL